MVQAVTLVTEKKIVFAFFANTIFYNLLKILMINFK